MDLNLSVGTYTVTLTTTKTNPILKATVQVTVTLPAPVPTLNFEQTWISNNTVAIGYSLMPQCDLMLDDRVIGNIKGTGKYAYFLNTTATHVNISCGNVSKLVTVISYSPKFTLDKYTGMQNTATSVSFTTNGLMQRIQCSTIDVQTTKAT